MVKKVSTPIISVCVFVCLWVCLNDSVFGIQPLEATEVYNRLLVLTIALSETLKVMVMF